jgi:hypothetical protein
MGALFVHHRLSPTVKLTGNAIVAERQTLMPGVQWQPHPDLTAGLVAGIGSTGHTPRPACSSAAARSVKAAYAWNPTASGERRCRAPIRPRSIGRTCR